MPETLPTRNVKLRRYLRFWHTRAREMRKFLWRLIYKRQPVLAHIIPIRRCNLACTYCNEFDDFSKPVPLEDMKARLDRLADLGTAVVTISGGEPLLHPELDDIIRHIRRRGMIAGLITNGYLLVPERIERLNQAGLEHLQISIDNVKPDDVSMKSLKVLDKKLEMLAQYSVFQININSVLGSGVHHSEDALEVAHRALSLGFTSTVGIIHDSNGQLQPLSDHEREIFEEIMDLGKRSFSRFNKFQHNIARGVENKWRCRSGSRYLYICEDGLVHWCSQQRGMPAVPLATYTKADLRREYFTAKPCAPYCTVSCVQQVALLDKWFGVQTLKPKFAPPAPTNLVPLSSLSATASSANDRR
jgi:MoaA/NifB/PqqE/SkfB family radical SAM enzyme